MNKILNNNNNNNNTNIRNQAKSPIYKNKSDNSNQSRTTASKPNNPSTPTATATANINNNNNNNNNKSPTLVEQTKKSHPSSTQSQSQILKNQKLPQYLSTTNMVRQPLNKTTPPATNFSNNYYKSEFIDYTNSNPLGNSNFGSPKTTNQTKLSQNNLANTNKNILSNPSAVTNPYTTNNVSYNPMFSSNNNVANSNKPAGTMPNYYPTMTQQQMASGQYYQPQIQPQTPQTAKGGQYQYMMPQYPQQPTQAPQIQPQYSQYYQKTSF